MQFQHGPREESCALISSSEIHRSINTRMLLPHSISISLSICPLKALPSQLRSTQIPPQHHQMIKIIYAHGHSKNMFHSIRFFNIVVINYNITTLINRFVIDNY